MRFICGDSDGMDGSDIKPAKRSLSFRGEKISKEELVQNSFPNGSLPEELEKQDKDIDKNWTIFPGKEDSLKPNNESDERNKFGSLRRQVPAEASLLGTSGLRIPVIEISSSSRRPSKIDLSTAALNRLKRTPRIEATAALHDDDGDEEEEEDVEAAQDFQAPVSNSADFLSKANRRLSTASRNSSLGSGSSDNAANEGLNKKIKIYFRKLMKRFRNWRLYKVIERHYFNAFNRVTFYVIGALKNIAAHTLLCYFIFNKILPHFWWYNTIYTALILFSVWTLTFIHCLLQEVEQALVAHSLVRGRATLGQLFKVETPYQGKTLHRIILLLARVFELYSVVIFIIYLNWSPADTAYVEDGVSAFPCIPATYPKQYERDPTWDVGYYLQGDSDYASIYTYGLPLGDGLIGGWSAWPLYEPKGLKSFSDEDRGILYAISTVCGEYVEDKWSASSTYIGITNNSTIPGICQFNLEIILPAYSHSVEELKSSAIKQYCTVRVVTGIGNVKCESMINAQSNS